MVLDCLLTAECHLGAYYFFVECFKNVILQYIDMDIRSDIIYELGEVDIDRAKLVLLTNRAYSASHKFVVQAQDDFARLYVCKGFGHNQVKEHFSLDSSTLVGGGSCYLDRQSQLVLDDYSASFGVIPQSAAEEFVKLLSERFTAEGIVYVGVRAHPLIRGNSLHSFWLERPKTL